MPEGVEVRLSADLIRPLIVGKRVINAFPDNRGRYGSPTGPQIEGISEFSEPLWDHVCRVSSVDVKGKFMYWTFDNGWFMFSTFGMTGQWSPTMGKHPCFEFDLAEKTPSQNSPSCFEYMFFNDPRHFGTIKFTQSKEELQKKLNALGWDPLKNPYIDYEDFLIKKVLGSKKPIGQLLMAQNVFAGVGNYIRAEALYLSKLSPWRLGNQLSRQELINLGNSIVQVMEDSYTHQGATIQTYKTAYGAEGKYSSCFKVYGKKTDPLGNEIIKEDTPDGRTIHWCPAEQF